MYAIVRDLPSSFVNCVTAVDNTSSPIDIELAKKQHEDYVEVLKQHVEHVIQVPADEAHPGKLNRMVYIAHIIPHNADVFMVLT